ncbi:cysteine hydrolase family protein [Scytonema sp. PCC 10023]|uniref:cysteine hydrolase family protein n=1 Tax=Scytonema sp. PCC 10023 TaxID=1680591 RepID=UPI0039C5E356
MKQDWNDFALILIDVQQGCWSSHTEIAFPKFSTNLASLLSFCRKNEIEVIHLRTEYQADKSDWMPFEKLGMPMSCIQGTQAVEFMDFANPAFNETVITKNRIDGFTQPELDQTLKSKAKKFLLLSGLNTSVCVLFTVASAVQKGYLTALVEDCCADWSFQGHSFTFADYANYLFKTTCVSDIQHNYTAWCTLIKQLG